MITIDQLDGGPIPIVEPEFPDSLSRLRGRVVMWGTDCWLWIGATAYGYGRTTYNGHRYYVHRMVYELVNGELSEGLCALHKCDNPACCNPDHLFAGTQTDNMADCHAKGRKWNHSMPRKKDNTPKVPPKTKLTADEVRNIRYAYSRGANQGTLSHQYGVAWVTIHNAITRKTWNHIH